MLSISSDVIRGYNDTFILYLLSDKPSYGYEISKQIKSLPNTEEVQKAKRELWQMMEDKYAEHKSEGKAENEAVGTVISEFGNLDEIADDLGIGKKSESEEGSVSLDGSAELEAFDNLEIDAGVMTLNINVGDTYGFGYECTNSKLVPKWSIKDGKLVIEQQESKMILGNSSCLVTITIPNGSSLEKAEIDIGVGDIYISGCEIEKLEMDSGTGNIDVNGVFYTVEADSGTGDISIKCEGDLSEYMLDLDAGVGSITLDGSKVGQQVTTSEYKSQGSGVGKISADTGVGDIEIIGQATKNAQE